MRNEFLWVEKYRPKTIDECILPDSIKKTFNDFLAQGEIPNLLLLVLQVLVKQQLLRHYVNSWGVTIS